MDAPVSSAAVQFDGLRFIRVANVSTDELVTGIAVTNVGNVATLTCTAGPSVGVSPNGTTITKLA